MPDGHLVVTPCLEGSTLTGNNVTEKITQSLHNVKKIVYACTGKKSPVNKIKWLCLITKKKTPIVNST